MVLATELLFIQTLHRFVINPGDCVAVGEEFISFSIAADSQNGRFADASALPQYSAALHFRINLIPSESIQE